MSEKLVKTKNQAHWVHFRTMLPLDYWVKGVTGKQLCSVLFISSHSDSAGINKAGTSTEILSKCFERNSREEKRNLCANRSSSHVPLQLKRAHDLNLSGCHWDESQFLKRTFPMWPWHKGHGANIAQWMPKVR